MYKHSPIKLLSFCFLMLFFTAALKANAHYNIRDFGAKGDGKNIDSDAINKAIAAAATAGGGTVYFPAGNYLSYSIRLKSNISLYLDQGCFLIAADASQGGKYDEPDAGPGNKYQDFGHSHWHNSLIWGENLENISILGPGTILGKALSRGFYHEENWEKKGIPAGPYMWEGGANKTIALKLCKNVILKDFTIIKGGHFGILATGVDNLTIDNLKIDTNRDGMDIDGCKNVRIANCSVNSPNDDAICLKSSFALGYAKATENVTITNCQVSGYDVGTFIDGTYQTKEGNLVPDQEGPTGRIKFGTESNGGFKNITISNCVFDHCRGLALETVDGALLEDVSISNITMRDVTNSPLFLRLGARMRGPEDAQVGKLRRINISNIVVYNADAHFSTLISGIPGHDIEDVKLSNMDIWYRPIDSAQNKIQHTVPEHIKDYPEPQKFGVLPAYGLFVRHVSGLEVNNVNLHLMGKETRPAMMLIDVKDAELYNVEAQKSENAALLKLQAVKSITIKGSKGLKDRTIKNASEKAY